MATHPASTLSFADFLRQVARVRAALDTPPERGRVRNAGIEPALLLERIRLVERIGAAMTAQDITRVGSLTVADKVRLARGSDATPTEVDDLLARYRRAVGGAECS